MVPATCITHHEVEECNDGEGSLNDTLHEVTVGKHGLIDGEVHGGEMCLTWRKRRQGVMSVYLQVIKSSSQPVHCSTLSLILCK